ncbi:HAD family hydrolase [Microbacterium thalli]|uniref:HAD family hydrolase n=1 Tax=Microbacterium thalli TaxID=3027921 RepID=UPI002366C7D9|nr:HAD family hydrolase [Microbacterium thalli]MDD7929025.1 hydrolase [Microbacterium thalli]
MPNSPLIIFDFDGTVALGDGPVLAYARAAAASADEPERFLARVDAGLRPVAAAAAAQPIDAYDVIRVAAVEAGVAPDALSRAYLSSRALLGSAEAPVEAPVGLAAVAAALAAECVLVTNAPAIRIAETLTALGLGDAFTRIVTDAGKPAGLDRLLDEPGVAGRRVLAVGDIWRNDLEPAHRRGHDTALVGLWPDPAATPTFRAATLTDLLPRIEAWAAASVS